MARTAILVVDDEAILCRAYCRLLAHLYEVDTAATAAEALTKVEARNYAAVLSDYHMPGENGLWLLAQTRRLRPTTRRVLTSGGVVPDLEAHLGSGVVEYFIAKPVERDALVEALEGRSTERPRRG